MMASPAAPAAPTRTEIFLGRLLAWSAHPYATWRTQSMSARVSVWLTYVVAAYALVLAALALG